MYSITVRLDFWKQAWNAFMTEPIWGIGWGEFPYWLYENSTTLWMDRNAHNIFLHFLAETGIIGFTLLVILLGSLFPIHYRRMDIPLYAVAGIMLAHSMVEFPYAYMQYLIVFGLAVGMANAK